MNAHTMKDLRELQAMPLLAKELLTRSRIHEWQYHTEFGVEKGVVSFSGGKDSTVLLHMCRELYHEIPAVFSNTGLEYPEIQSFVKKHDNVIIVRPKMRFTEVLSSFGYPLISKEVAECIESARRSGNSKYTMHSRQKLCGKRKNEKTGEKSDYNLEKWKPLVKLPIRISKMCCTVMKKNPMKAFYKASGLHPITATMADESRLREQSWIRHGCNAFDLATPRSQPMSFWTEQDVLQYIIEKGVEIAPVYGDIVAVDEEGNEYEPNTMLMDGCKLRCTGCQRTRCIFCAFGFHLDKGETRFQRLAKTHPRQYEYCIMGGQWVDNPDYDSTMPAYDGEWENWNPKKILVPSKEGLGMGKVFDMINEIFGKDLMRYE